MPSFSDLTAKSQVSRLRRAALVLLEQELEPGCRLSLLLHGFNTTFRVDMPGGARYALRMNVNSTSTLPQIEAETAWMRALSEETDLWVPVPQPWREGGFIHTVLVPGKDRPVPCVLYSWLPGSNLAHWQHPEAAGVVGAITAQLHRHAASWPLGNALGFRHFAGLYLTPEARILERDAGGLTDEVRATLRAFWDHLQAQTHRFQGLPQFPIHYDLHFENLKRFRGRFSVFDFDDAMYGPAIQDIGVSLYYIRRRKAWTAEWDAAYWKGYGQHDFDPALVELLIAKRNFYMADALFDIAQPEWQAEIPGYLRATKVRLDKFLETGVFEGQG